jgi:hypothetical protein
MPLSDITLMYVFIVLQLLLSMLINSKYQADSYFNTAVVRCSVYGVSSIFPMEKTSALGIDVSNLDAFTVKRKYPLRTNGRTILEHNVSHIFRHSCDVRELSQLLTAQQYFRIHVSTPTKASGAPIAEDVDRDVKYYMYNMVNHFVKNGALQCLFNDELVIEIVDIKIAPKAYIGFDFPSEPHCPLVVAVYTKTALPIYDLIIGVVTGTLLSYKVSQPVFEKLQTICAQNAATIISAAMRRPNIGILPYERKLIFRGVCCMVAMWYFTLLSAASCFTVMLLVTIAFWRWKRKCAGTTMTGTITFFTPLPRKDAEPVKAFVNARVCGLPGCSESAHDRCERCRVTRYCCRQHQVQHWLTHKEKCKKFPKLTPDNSIVVPVLEQAPDRQHLIVPNTSQSTVYEMHVDDSVEGKFVVKVQPKLRVNTAGRAEIDSSGSILVYDAVKAFCIYVNPVPEQAAQHAKFLEFIQREGIVTYTGIRTKAYFYAKREKNTNALRVYIGDPCEAPAW